MKLTDSDKLAIKQQFMSLAESLAANVTEALELLYKNVVTDADATQVKAIVDSIVQSTVDGVENSANSIATELRKKATEVNNGD